MKLLKLLTGAVHHRRAETELTDVKSMLYHPPLNQCKECSLFWKTEPSSLTAVKLGPTVKNVRLTLCLTASLNLTIIYLFQLWLLVKVKPFLDCADLKKVIHAFISPILLIIVMHSILASPSHPSVFATHAKCCSVPSSLASCPFWNQFKFFSIVFKALTGIAPPHLSDILTLQVKNKTIRSSNQDTVE